MHRADASRAWERDAIAAAAARGEALSLMQRAGRATARLALAVAPHARRIWLLAGPGNNGGDALEAAVHLHQAGKAVAVSLAAEPGRLPPDAAASLARARAAGISIDVGPQGDAPRLGRDDLAVDGLLGLGTNRPPEAPLAQLIEALSTLPCPVLAIDIPSGLHPDTGQPIGRHAVRAAHTLSLLTLKPGLFTGAGRDHAGVVWFDDLDAPCTAPPDAWLGPPDARGSRERRHAQHKGSFGNVVVVGGDTGMVGAALLAGRAALAAGAGRVWLQTLDPAAHRGDALRPELMWRTPGRSLHEPLPADATLVCGCGGGTGVAEVLPAILDQAARLVLDADALNAVAANPDLFRRLAARSADGRPSVLTPHPLEAARMLGTDTAAVQADRLAAAAALAGRSGAVVVLKGSGSVIAAPGEVPRVNPTGNAALATAGSGDVLAGWLGGLLSAGSGSEMPQSPLRQAFETACEATYTHGLAADRAGVQVLRASDLIEQMAQGSRQARTRRGSADAGADADPCG